MAKQADKQMVQQGGCHCGAIRFEVDVPSNPVCQECNCSICSMSGHIHLIVPASAFRLLQGESSLVLYQFNSKTAKHYACRVCAIKPFYISRSNPDGYDVNVRCLDNPPENMTLEQFDGLNWEQHAHTLAHLSKPG